MDMSTDGIDTMPVVRDLAHFDQRSGNLLERLVFNNRLWMIVLCTVVTVVLGAHALASWSWTRMPRPRA